jgi:hypothetical protein
MVEVIFFFVFFIAGWIVLKITFFVFKVGFWALSLPLQILAAVLVLVLGLLFFIPFSLVFGLLAIPFLLIFALLPLLLLGWGIYLLLRS